MNGLSPEQRSSLERTVVGLRKTLEQDLRATLAGRYGINQDGTIDAAGTLRLGSDEVPLREELLEVLDVLRKRQRSCRRAVGRLVREAAFTHANRLTAVRIAEATDLLPSRWRMDARQPATTKSSSSRQDFATTPSKATGSISDGAEMSLRRTHRDCSTLATRCSTLPRVPQRLIVWSRFSLRMPCRTLGGVDTLGCALPALQHPRPAP